MALNHNHFRISLFDFYLSRFFLYKSIRLLHLCFLEFFHSLTSPAVISEEVMVNHFLPGLRCLHADMEQLSPEHEVRTHRTDRKCAHSPVCRADCDTHSHTYIHAAEPDRLRHGLKADSLALRFSLRHAHLQSLITFTRVSVIPAIYFM